MVHLDYAHAQLLLGSSTTTGVQSFAPRADPNSPRPRTPEGVPITIRSLAEKGRSDLKAKQNWMKVKLAGVRSNRSAIGSRVLALYGGKVQAQAVVSRSSYCSCNDPRLRFDLGTFGSVDIQIDWPNGLHEKFKAVPASQLGTRREGKGIMPGTGWGKCKPYDSRAGAQVAWAVGRRGQEEVCFVCFHNVFYP